MDGDVCYFAWGHAVFCSLLEFGNFGDDLESVVRVWFLTLTYAIQVFY